MFETESKQKSTQLKDWASNHWNWLDLIAIMLFYVALGLRYSKYEQESHVLFALDVALFILKLLNIVSIHPKMGPYVVMIGRMVSFSNIL